MEHGCLFMDMANEIHWLARNGFEWLSLEMRISILKLNNENEQVIAWLMIMNGRF